MRPAIVLVWAALLVPAGAAAADALAVAPAAEVRLDDAELRRRWRSLFTVDPWPARAIAACLRAEEGAALLASRLLHRGGPWVPPREQAPGEEAWRRHDRQVCASVLRALRYRPHPGLADVYERFLAEERRADLVRSALANLHRLDPQRAHDATLRLVDPHRADAWPGAAEPAVRRDALALAFALLGPDAFAVEAGLGYALLDADDRERLHALRLLPPGTHADLVAHALRHLVEEHRAGRLDAEGRRALVLALARGAAAIDGELAGRLVAIAVDAERDLACAAIDALLAAGVAQARPAEVDRIARRAAETTDLALRHSLLALLLRLDAERAREAAGLGSPWAVLATHRMELGGK